MELTMEQTVDDLKVPQGYQLTEAGVIPNDWVVKSISQLCKLINGRGFKPHEWKDTGLPIIRIQNLNGSDDYNYFEGIYNPKILIENGQLLFAWSGSRGTSFGPHIWKGKTALLNYHTWKVIVNEKEVDPDFFLHALRHLTKHIEDKAHGASALVHTQKGEMEAFLMALPPSLKEQKRISLLLSDADLLIENVQRLVSKKRSIKQGVMQELLKPKVGWTKKKWKDISPFQRGFDLPTSDVREGRFPVVYSNGIGRNHDTYACKAPGVVTGRSGTIGKITFVDVDYWPHNTALWITDFKGNDPKFIYYLLQSIKIERFATGSGVPTLNRNDVHEFEVCIPSSLQEQVQIKTILTHIDAEIESLEQKLEKYKMLKQGMMQKLLTGKTRLVNPNPQV